MPYVHFASPGAKHAWPKSAACWSPSAAATGSPASAPPRLAVDLHRRPDLGQHRPRHAHRVEHDVVPVERLEVHQHRPPGVRDVRVVAAGEVPDQPRVHRPEQHVAGLGALAQPVDVVEQPADLRARRSTSPAAARSGRGSGRRPASPPSSCTRWSVRMSCQLIALWTGAPVARSHSTVVSRWLVMPSPTRSRTESSRGRERVGDDVLDVVPDLHRVVLDVARAAGRCGWCSTWLTETIARRARRRSRQREEAVPWSTEAM